MNIGIADTHWFRQGADAHPNSTPWFVSCTDGTAGIAWVPTGATTPSVSEVAGPAPAVDPATLVDSVFGIVPLPPIQVGMNPTTGLVAMPSWFWVEGYDGSGLRGSRTLGLTTVEVEIAPQSYQWSFGDGATLATQSLGQAYPAESDIRHTYEQSSLAASGAYTVRLEITFSARYRVNGGSWAPLASVSRSFARDYPVQQVQSVLTAAR